MTSLNYRKKFYILNKSFDFWFNVKKSLVLIKGYYGIISLRLPSYYFIKNNNNLVSFLFLNRFFFMSFIKHFFYTYNRLFLIYFIRLKIKGLGYRIRKVSNNLYYFFFNYTNMFYFNIPNNIMVKWYKKRLILLSNDFFMLKLIFSHILLLKKLGPYRLRGLRYPRQIILLKKSKKSF
jgi:hypothetical protein